MEIHHVPRSKASRHLLDAPSFNFRRVALSLISTLLFVVRYYRHGLQVKLDRPTKTKRSKQDVGAVQGYPRICRGAYGSSR